MCPGNNLKTHLNLENIWSTKNNMQHKLESHPLRSNSLISIHNFFLLPKQTVQFVSCVSYRETQMCFKCVFASKQFRLVFSKQWAENAEQRATFSKTKSFPTDTNTHRKWINWWKTGHTFRRHPQVFVTLLAQCEKKNLKTVVFLVSTLLIFIVSRGSC